MLRKTFVIVCAIFGVSIVVSACSVGNLASQQPSSQPSASPTAQAIFKSSPSLSSSIRDIDFGNFTYPAKPAFSDGRKSFRLQHGRSESDKTHDPVILA